MAFSCQEENLSSRSDPSTIKGGNHQNFILLKLGLSSTIYRGTNTKFCWSVLTTYWLGGKAITIINRMHLNEEHAGLF